MQCGPRPGRPIVLPCTAVPVATRRKAHPLLLGVVGILVVTSGGCADTRNRPDGGDADRDSIDPRDAPAETDAPDDVVDSDGRDAVEGGGSGAGPLTLVVTGGGFTTERTRDFDGDGDLDNALADLGSPSAEILVAALNGSKIGRRLEEGQRLVFHFPWVEDLGTPEDPEVVGILFKGLDTDVPEDRSDDFSGTEPFVAPLTEVDDCGEPIRYLSPAAIVGGVVETAPMAAALDLDANTAPLRAVSLSGTVAPGGSGGELLISAYWTIADLGAVEDAAGIGGFTALEVFVGGGEPFGLPVSGLSPNVDLDGDGLERCYVDDEGLLSECVDGDSTVVSGPDCWRDPRMADAFGVVLRTELTSAVFQGRAPGWEARVEAYCEGGQPDPSLFDPL